MQTQENPQENLSSQETSETEDELIVQEYPHSSFSVSVLTTSPDPETCAALGAQQSRSPASLVSRAGRFTGSTRERIMGKYFRNYGHNSVGEMGNLFFSIEGISMIAALRAIDTPLFRGQEASTRYMDFSSPLYSLPELLQSNKAANTIVCKYFGLYNRVLDMLLKKYRKQGMDDKDARPRAFDVAGGFLPCATKTSVVFTCNIRTMIEQALRLQSYFGNTEVCSIGGHLLDVIDAQCPNSVNMEKSEGVGKLWEVRTAVERHFCTTTLPRFKPSISFEQFYSPYFLNIQDSLSINADNALMYENTIGRFGTIKVSGVMSVRSLRDIWRHRPFAHLFIQYPTSHFVDWYLNEIPKKHRGEVTEEVNGLITHAKKIIPPEDFTTSDTLLYILPLGCSVFFEMSGPVDKWLYFLNLRSGVKVHPEVRQFVHTVVESFKEEGIKCSADLSPESDYGKRSKDC